MTDIEANPHLEKPPQRFGTPPKDAASAVILVHGRGQTPEIMFDLVVGRFPENLLAWLAFWSAGNHDDRTLVAILEQ